MRQVPLRALLRLGRRTLPVILALTAALPATAQRSERQRPAVDRAELAGVLERLTVSGVAEASRTSSLRQRLTELSDAQWTQVERFLAERPGWRELPAILERNRDLDARRTAFRARLGVPEGEPRPGSPAERERFRADFLLMIAQLRDLSPLMDVGWDERLQAISDRVGVLDAEELEAFEQAFVAQFLELAAERPEAFRQASGSIPGTGAGPATATRVASAAFDCPDFSCNFNLSIPNGCAFGVCVHDILDFLGIPRKISFDACTATGFASLLNGVCNQVDALADGIVDFVNDAGASITGAFDEVVGFVEDIPMHLESLVADIVGGVETILAELGSIVPLDFESFVGFLGSTIGIDVDSPDWWESVPGLSVQAVPALAQRLDADDSERVASALELGSVLPCPAEGLELPVIGTVGTPSAEFTCNNAAKVYGEFVDFVPSTAEFFVSKLLFSIDRAGIDYLCLCLEHSAKRHTIGDSDTFRELVDEKLDDSIGSRASQAGMDALGTHLAQIDQRVLTTDGTLRTALGNAADLAGDFSSHTQLVEDLSALLERLDLEARLLEASDGQAGALALPAALGGSLETIGEIVREAVAAADAAGQPVHNAVTFLDRAERDLADGLYDRAFDNYQRAYGETVRTTGN